MKKILWMILSLLLVNFVSAQTTNPFEAVGEPLGNLFDAIAQFLGLQFVSEAYHLEALFRLLLWVFVFTIIHQVLKRTLGTAGATPGAAATTALLEEKAVNVLSIVVSISLAIFTPIEILFQGAAVLIAFTATALIIGIYWSFRIGKSVFPTMHKGPAAIARAGILVGLLLIQGALSGQVEKLETLTIGKLTLSQVPNIAGTKAIFETFLGMSMLVTIIMIVVNIILLFAVHGMPAPTAPPGGVPGRGIANWFTDVFKGASAALKTIQKFKEQLMQWQTLIAGKRVDVFQKLTPSAPDAYMTFVNELHRYDVATVERELDPARHRAAARILTSVNAEKNIIAGLFAAPTHKNLRDLTTAAPPTRTQIDNTLKSIKDTLELLKVLEQLNKKVATTPPPTGTPTP